MWVSPHKQLYRWCRREVRNSTGGNPWAESTAKRDALRGRLGFWKAIGCSKNVMSRLAYGKKLSFRQEPEHLSFDNHKSISKHRDFVLEQSRDCLDATFFRLVDPSFAKVINPIKVEPKGNGKWRMCHDLRCVNSETAYSQFRLSTLIGALPGLLQPGDELIVGDLTSAYYFVNMHESAWPYLFRYPSGADVRHEPALRRRSRTIYLPQNRERNRGICRCSRNSCDELPG